ncbi:MAG: hypothetical protein ABH952_01640 [Candidatus Omnitrophota bacterium]
MLFFAAIFLFIFVISVLVVIKKQIHIWIWSYIFQSIKRNKARDKDKPINIYFCFVDHFEPQWNNPSYEQEKKRVDLWVQEYPKLAKRHRDSRGCHPQHTFFYPAEEYRKEHLDKLAMLCKTGFGDIEIHLHHDHDTADGLKKKINDFKEKLYSHGLLSKDENGRIRYGFIHGNWALDNSRKDGRWCGVNNELEVLRETGCYADFTLPSAPSDTQTQKINSIYYAKDDPLKPKSHNCGIDVEVGKLPCGDLMIVQGPLGLNWKERKWRIFPRIENGDICGNNPPTEYRVDLWVEQHIHVKGAPNHIFIKAHTHGAQEKNRDILLGKSMDEMFDYLEKKYNDGEKYLLFYVTAKEIYDIIKNIEKGNIS